MEIVNLLPVTTRAELRQWLSEHAKSEACCWAVVSVTPAPNTLLYLDAVEEALCFGWIDSTKKKISETDTAQRLSPRSARSAWTELNKARVRRLEQLGLMTDAGRAALPDMDPDAFRIHPDIERRLREDPQTFENFLNFPELYRRVRIDTIQSYRHQPEVFESRLDKFVEQTKRNRMFGQWHDNGRLMQE
jgi:uncharacterized protein YdeI (YjbR/CyaY-like superfamily)